MLALHLRFNFAYLIQSAAYYAPGFMIRQNNHIPKCGSMNPRKADQKEIRVTVTQDVYSLLKRLAGVKETSMNKLMNLAVDRLLEDEDIQELIQRYNLED